MTYEYICSKCDTVWDEEQRITDAPIDDCPICDGELCVKRLLSSGAFVLKGAGWAADGYSKNSGENT